jgi:hypothetical protein
VKSVRKKTTNEESVGYDNFIVCNKCFDKLAKKYSYYNTLQIIFDCGRIREERKK